MTTAGGPLEGPGASLPVSTAQPPAELRGEGAAVQHPPARASPSGRVSSLGGRAAANLLLNFQYSERNRQQWRGGADAARGRRTHQPTRPYNREAFLNANFRFLVSDGIDLANFQADADRAVDWDDVVSVTMPSTHPLACPISLDAPVCPQITRCGHIFSFPSLMQFLIYAGGSELRKAAPCPLCFTNIAARELRTAQVQLVDQVEVGATLDFRLLRRPKGSSIPELANVVRPDSGGAPADAHSFAKVSPVSDPTELWAEQAAKLAQFAAQVSLEGGRDAAFEASAAYDAIAVLEARARAWHERRQRAILEAANPNLLESLLSAEEAGRRGAEAIREAGAAAATVAAHAHQEQAAAEALQREFPSLTVPEEGATAAPGSGATSRTLQPDACPWTGPATSSGPGASTTPGAVGGSISPMDSSLRAAVALSDDYHYFYQCADGQWYFLGPLNCRMLLQHFGSFAACPPVFSAKLLELEAMVQTEQNRKRFRALGHVPLTGAYSLCEVDLAGVLPPPALAQFSEELAERQRKRAQRQRQDERRTRQEAARAAAAAPRPSPSAQELKAMPRPSASVGGTGAEQAEGSGLREEDVEPSCVPELPEAGVSFARIAAMGFAATGPALAPATSWAAAAGPGVPAEGQQPVVRGAWAAAPAHQTQPSPSQATAVPGTSSKKKSGKQRLLLSTTQRRY